ncbi:hypothetical protein THASP1DRAFT_27981 [Thamnocephalis sphaerospora]|uniref:MAPEG family-domain-containing protein n=1 Tax=Thamnocephalis sphaerospora TaxID=78915 RepID=A0A4P9XVF1_9FUNG|nr:hypothetical protein THASP1DRAFT_27981 [Thamnocephalis sphaerospora]|eukprot:RKP10253.1 hypothetical protein THASP1DRAFT_27981 [Thamnocephalis sphaerospora]
MRINWAQVLVLLPVVYGGCLLLTVHLQTTTLVRSLSRMLSGNPEHVPFVALGLVFLLTYTGSSFVSVVANAAGTAGGLDNKAPRLGRAHLRGWAHRAVAAHQNLLEGFPGFAAAVFAAFLRGAPNSYTASLATLHLLARCVYYPAYVLNLDQVRTGSYGVSLAASVLLFGFACVPDFESFYLGLVHVAKPWA